MTRTKSRHLLDMLADVPDPRKKKGKRHPLRAILALTIIAGICGYKSYSTIAEWGRTYDDTLTQALGFTHKKTPCAATLYNVFRRLDVQALEETLTKWATHALESFRPSESHLTGVTIDGKTLRGSRKQNAKLTHLMSVVSHELGITLTQKAMSEKTHEIPVSREILKAFDVRGKVVTADALLTQRAFCESAIAMGGDYVLPVKANQKEVFHDIQCLFPRPGDVETNTGYRRFQAEHREWAKRLTLPKRLKKHMAVLSGID